MDQFAMDQFSMMESNRHHPIAVLGLVCSTVISAKPAYLDRSLCSGLGDCFNFTAHMLTEVQQKIDSVVQKYPDMFRELYIIAYRAHILVEKCCSQEWLRILFLQACTSHKEEALDLIDDLEWCIAEIWKISCLPRQPSQALLKFKKLLKECENSDRSELLKQLERHALLPLARQELQLTKYLLERIKVQVVASTPRAIEISLDYRKFNLTGANGFTDSVLVGEGSSAKVYKTTILEIQCAKKVQTAVSKDQLQELAKQARKLTTLSHPHVIKLLGFYENKRTDEGIFEGHWLMECMDGDLLSNIRRCLNQYPISVDILLQIAKGVRYLHDNDVAHRDLKCGNILVSQSPISSEVSTSVYKDYFHIKVTDFDQSKFFTSNCSDLQVQSKHHVGSTPWRAPEAFTEPGKSMVNPKSADSYSFAMTCFELLSGENPFSAMPGINWANAKEALVAGRRPPLPKDCPELLRDLIVECWRTNPRHRPAFPEICRRLQDCRAFLLTGSLTHRKRQRGAPSFWRHNAQRFVSMFKNMRMAVTTTRKQIPVPRLTMAETEAPFTHTDSIQNVQQVPEVDLLHTQDHRTLKTAKVVVGLDLGTTHTGVAYAMLSNPDEIFTISHWPLVGEEAYHCKTLTAIYKSSPDGDCLWGYPARREYGKKLRGNGQSSGSGSYFGELKKSLLSTDFDPEGHQPVVDYLRELGKFVLGYLQREYPLEFLEMDLLRWCITVPSNWSSDLKQKLGSCMVNADLVRGQIEQENVSSSFYIFLESDAAACYCNGYFAHVKMKKGDRLCVLDVGGGNVQCIFEDWEGSGHGSYDGTQKVYGVRSSCVESLVQENFLKFILGKEHESSSCRHLLRDDPSVWVPLLDELDSLKVDLNHSIKIPSNIMMHFERCNSHNRLQNPRVTGDHRGSQCALNYTLPSDERLPSSSDTKSIFKPLVDGVVSFLQEQLQSEPDVKRLFVVGGYVKHVYFLEEIRNSFPNLRIDMPKNPGSAVCKGAVVLGLKSYFEFQAGLEADASFKFEGGEQGTNHNDKKSDGDNHQGDQPESSGKANLNSRSYPRVGRTSDTKGSQQVDDGDQMDVDSCREKMLVTLDFGTSQMGFAYGLESHFGEITVCKDDQKRTTDLYYKLYHDTLRLHSCGQKVKDDIVEDFNQQPDDSQDFVPALIRSYVSKPKLHLVVDNIDPEVELHLPAGLIIDDVISDCLREYGHFILEQLQEKFGNDFKLHHIQWCLLVPSFWGENTKRRMEACMINAGLLRGLSNVDGSPYPLVTVLEAEAASMACIDHLSLRKGSRFLVASIGDGTLDMVIQEWIGDLGMYDMKEVGSSTGGLYGSSCLDLNFLALLSMKMGAWVSDYLERFPLVLIDMMSEWEQIKVVFSDDCELKYYMLHLPIQLQNAWRRFECRSVTSKAGTSYESLELTSNDVKMVFEPVVQTILKQISGHLATSSYVDALVVLGGFAKSPYLHGQMVCRFGDQRLLRLADTESVVLKGALLFAQHPKGIRSRIARKTYGLGMSTDFNAGVFRTCEISNEVERFRIDVEKGCCLGVDFYVESYHQPISPGQESMKFTLYSSIESYPRFTGEQSVAKEWDFVVDISDSVKQEKNLNIRIRLYYGRSAVEVVAEAMNFGNGNQLPVMFAIGTHNVKKPLDAIVAKKTYGVGTRKFFEMWDLPEYRNTHGVDQGDTCDLNFDIYIERGTPVDSFVSRTYYPIYNKQQSLSFTLYSSTDISPRYITDETAMKEGDFEVDIQKGLYLDKDREISLRMCFTRTNIRISAVALNFAGEDRNLPVRLRYGNWVSQVSLTLARQLRMVPLQPSSLMREKSSQQNALVLAVPEISHQPDQGGPLVSEGSKRVRPVSEVTTSQPSQSEETHAVHPFHKRVKPLCEAFVCPLTKQVMQDPVTLENGQIYERAAIEHWFKECKENGQPTLCPMTGRKVDTTVKSRLALRNTIEEWTARNEQARIEIVMQIITSGGSDDDIVFGLTDLQTLCRKNRMNKHRVRQEGLIPLIVDLLKNGEEVRCLALRTLRLLAEDDEDNKEAIGASNLSDVVKCLSRELTREREGAVYLLYELSKSYSLCNKIGATNGAVFTLVGMLSSNSEDAAVVEHAELALANLERCDDNVKQMAENGRLQPVFLRLVKDLADEWEGSRPGKEASMERVAERVDLQSKETSTEEIKLVNQISGLLGVAAVPEGLEIPADFRCPLSGELMADPVIVASGQTYERIYIQHWLGEGLTRCPKTHQQLFHRCLIPNYTVKALIANWCKTHGLPVPSQVKLKPYVSNLQPSFLGAAGRSDADSKLPSLTGTTRSGFRSSGMPKMLNWGTMCARGTGERCAPGELAERARSVSLGELEVQNALRRSPSGHAVEHSLSHSRSHSRMKSNRSEASSVEDGPVAPVTMIPGGTAIDPFQIAHERYPDTSDISGLANRGIGLPGKKIGLLSGSGCGSEIGSRLFNDESWSPPRLGERSTFGRRGGDSEISLPRIGLDTFGADSSAQSDFERLVQDLQSSDLDTQRQAACELRMLAKHNMENRVTIAKSGAIEPLVALLNSGDGKTQVNAVTALLNLSIYDKNKAEIALAGAIGPLVNVLRVGNAEAMENAAATLYSLSVMDDNKVTIGVSGAIPPLVHLLINGSPRGKKDAASALFNLSIYHGNKGRIVHAGAIGPLVELMAGSAAGMADRAVAVLANLATIAEGRQAIGEHDGIPALVEEVHVGSQRGKENAAAALLQLCTNSDGHRPLVLLEGVIPQLVLLSQSGTPRAKEKASALLRHFREHRYDGMGGRSNSDKHMAEHKIFM